MITAGEHDIRVKRHKKERFRKGEGGNVGEFQKIKWRAKGGTQKDFGKTIVRNAAEGGVRIQRHTYKSCKEKTCKN